ncbi:riboflavin kinase / FMN adenylyltransferase [Thalassobacillus cyri]|uniref:Riboflavin biosynthesis protein n=1 Tax=Thalassobacillus cyri TaxID=571932 RepID=A0A1H4G0H0_9BACI|nr:bifunctional riboflavin kinase/FAD synthetase [Thalassobacillus cyri]SEB02560.1 riboflavin kinase / FMN adenylyltransferase [Thalassobacillus cyri]
MKITELKYPHDFDTDDFPPSALALGFFDGVHKGHQKLINTAVAKAREDKLQSAVMTFYPHPSVVLKKQEQHAKYITPLREKQQILERLGVEQLFIVNFDEWLADLLPQEFVDQFLIQLNVRHVIAGFDYSYGRMGRGNMETLPFHSRGKFDQTVIEKVEDHDEKISSTRIRHELKQGNMQEVSRLLDRPFSTYGRVVEGDQRGRTIGFPTANIQLHEDYLLPRVGVYAVSVKHNGQVYTGMANLGYKPTFQDDAEKPNLEVYIFDFSGDIYNDWLEVYWHAFIRKEEKFNGVEALIEQLKLDELEIRRFFSDHQN